LEVNPPGPVQLYAAPATVVAMSCRVAPSQIAPLFEAVGAAGAGLTVTDVVPGGEVHPPIETLAL
jgi:hypothetical protein